MKKQFVTYEIALTLKELGFNEECLGFYKISLGNNIPELIITKCNYNSGKYITIPEDFHIDAPLWQQAINWLFKKLDFYYPYLRIEIFSDESGIWYRENNRVEIYFDNLEQAILKAIDIIKKEQK